MPESDEPGRVNRRAFLKAVGLSVGALAVPPLLSGPAPAAARAGRALTIGIVAPSSTLHPRLGAAFLAGAQLALERPGAPAVQLRVLDYGVSVAAALQHTRALVEDSQVDLVISMVSGGMASGLHALLSQRGVPLLVSGAGANITRADRDSPFLVRSSLAYWQSSYALGAWSARSLGRRALMATSFYDSGYDAGYAFQLGFERAGGTVLGTQVTHLPTDTRGVAPALERIAAERPDVVYAAYSGRDAVEAVRAFAAAGLPGRIPLVGSGFLTDESLLGEQGDAALGIYTALPWAPALQTEAHRSFARAYAARAGAAPDAFAALGHDTMRLAVAGLEAADGAGGDALLRALADVSFEGPRGRVAMDPAARSATSPIYLREVRRAPGGLTPVAVAQLPAPVEDAALAAVRSSTLTGWEYAYLSY